MDKHRFKSTNKYLKALNQQKKKSIEKQDKKAAAGYYVVKLFDKIAIDETQED